VPKFFIPPSNLTLYSSAVLAGYAAGAVWVATVKLVNALHHKNVEREWKATGGRIAWGFYDRAYFLVVLISLLGTPLARKTSVSV